MCIRDRSAASLVSLANKLADAGVQLIQLRAKRLAPRQIQEIANALITAAPANVKILINDRPDIASIANAAGVHVGQQDLTVTCLLYTSRCV